MTEQATAAGAGITVAGFDRRLVPPMILGSVLNPVNSSIIAVALIPIGAAFGAPPSQTAWLVSALYLASALGQPVTGRLVDIFGPRRLFLAATSLAGIAGVIGTLAPNLPVLIAARALLGLGTCAGNPAAMALLRSEASRTGRHSPAWVLTAMAVANQTIAVIGPLLGGLLIGIGGWRATFAISIALAAAALVLGLRLPSQPAGGPRDGAAAGSGAGALARLAGRLDLPGMGLFAVMLTCLLLFMMSPRASHWHLLVITAVAGAGFAARELRASSPFIDLRAAGGNVPLLVTFCRGLVAYAVTYSFFFGFTQWTEEGYGLSPLQAGLAQAPMFLTAIAVSVVTGRRREVFGKLLLGSLAQVAACLLMLALAGDSPLWLLLVLYVVFGAPVGTSNLGLQNSIYFQADAQRVGSSAGLLRTFAYLGSMIAASATAASYGEHASTGGMHQLAWVMLGCAVAYLLITAFDRSLRRMPAIPAGTGPGHDG